MIHVAVLEDSTFFPKQCSHCRGSYGVGRGALKHLWRVVDAIVLEKCMVPDTLARPSAAKVPVATSSMHIYNIKSHFLGSQEVEIQLVSEVEIQLVS